MSKVGKSVSSDVVQHRQNAVSNVLCGCSSILFLDVIKIILLVRDVELFRCC